ncbi:MAG: hypothetical protein AB7H66_13050 [Hyphomonadaceae bacterium]
MAFALLAVTACAGAPVAPSATERDPPVFVEALTDALTATGDDPGGGRAQVLSLVGREDLFTDRDRTACAPLLRDGVAVDPVDEIARLASGRRVVIINEAHDHPQHRAFIAEVASALRRDGFAIYAAETFAPSIREQRGWLGVRDGYYTNEPAYAALVRRIRAEGFALFDYEHLADEDRAPPVDGDWAPRIARREAGQAANLQAILNAHPNDRVLVHVGHGHLQELPDDNGNLFMAARLKQATGIDPLTIDLTRYEAATDEFVFCDPAQASGLRVDFRIGTPRGRFANGRPAWRQRAGQKPVYLPAMANPDLPTIWEARNTNDPDDAAAIDRILLRSGETLPFLLPPGRYRAESWSVEHGWSTSSIEFQVE